MPDFSRDDKTAFIARSVAPVPGTRYQDGVATANGFTDSPHTYMVRVPIEASAGTCVGWRNPHAGSIIVDDVYVYWSTAGTGTVDVGTGTSGTGASNVFIDGGTMAAGILFAEGTGGTAGAAAAGGARLVRGSGTVADSVTITINEAGTSTAVGTMFFRVTVL